MRMFEATGSGAALVTEQKSNLSDFFADDEVLAYSSIDDAARLAAEAIADPVRLDRVAAAGRARTLSEHTYAHRAQRLTSVLESRL
jgi:spore maturation protein CgeB